MNPLLAIGLLLTVLALLVILWIVGRRLPRQESNQAQLTLYEPSLAPRPRPLHPRLTRSVALVGIGTYGIRQVGRLLTRLSWADLDELISGVLVVENDAQERMKFAEDLAKNLPRRHPPIHYGYSDVFDLGLSSRPIPEVLDQIHRWGPQIDSATSDFIDTILRQTANRYPGLILAFLSLGGQAPLSVPVLASLRRHFPETPIFVGTALPTFTQLRMRFIDIKSQIDRLGGVWGWLLADNLSGHSVDIDYGMIALIVGAAAGALHEDTPLSINNLLSLALPIRGGLMTYRFLHVKLPAYSYSSHHRQFFTYIDPVVDAVLTSLDRLQAGDGIPRARWPAHPGKAIDVVLANIIPEDMQRVADRVRSGIRARSAIHNQPPRPDYELIFSTWALPIEAQRPYSHITVLRIEGLDPAVPLDVIVGPDPQTSQNAE